MRVVDEFLAEPQIGRMTQRLLQGLALFCAGTMMGACASEAPARADVLRADSAGVKRITSLRADTALAWRFDTVGVLTDSLGAPWVFTALSPPMVLTDRAGRTYVLEREPAIRRFGRTGQYERSIGRKGAAPGEMDLPLALMQQGDSLVVFDVNRRALVRWGSDLEPINDMPFRGALERMEAIRFRVGGAWVMRDTFDSLGNTTSSLYADTLDREPLLRVSRTSPRTLPLCGSPGGATMRVQLPRFFSPEIQWTTAGARMLANAGPGYELQLYEGPRLLASVRRQLPLQKADETHLAVLYPEGIKLAGSSVSCTIPLSTVMESIGVAEYLPFVQGLALTTDGTMWVQRSLRNEPPVLDVFGSDGAYAGTVRGFGLPLGLLPNGELLVPQEDEASGGFVITRLRVAK